PVVLQVLIHIKRVQVFGIEAGEQHVHHDDDVDLFFALVGHVLIGKLLILDARLHILVVEIEFADTVIGAKAGVVVGDDGLERLLFLLRFLFVVGFFLWQVFLNLLHILVALGGRREHAGDVQRLKGGVCILFFSLKI